MPQSETPRYSAWPLVGFPFVQGLMLTGLLVIFLLVVFGGSYSPQLLRESGAYPEDGDRSPFSLGALRDRLPEKGLASVQRFVRYYTKVRRRGLEDGLARSTRYVEAIKRIFRAAELPAELSYLPLIESGFMEHAVSPANAVGVWQFIPETGRRYNLKATDWFDEKRDPIFSSHAAAKYLGHLHEKFNDWELAVAAYNAGEGTIYWAVRANRKAGLPTDFWSLDLPEETTRYVPAFLAAMLIAKNPVAYGFHEIKFLPEMAYEYLQVDSAVSLRDIAKQLETDLSTLTDLNPALVAGITPPGKRPYLLRIPRGLGSRPVRLTDLKFPTADWLLYRVGARDTVQRLASKFSASPYTIRKINRLAANQDLKPGGFVLIPL